jgi:peptidyl-prolyl cis-trans isomerase C
MLKKLPAFSLLKFSIKTAKAVLIFLSVLLLLDSCSWRKENLSHRVVLKAELTSMTAEEFAKILAEKLSVFDALTAKDASQISRIKTDIERDFIIRAIIEAWSKRENIVVDNKEIETEINKIRESFSNDLAFRQELSKQGISFNEWQKKMAYVALEKKVFQKITTNLPPPTDDEISRYYETNKPRFIHKEKILLRQIVLATEPAADKIHESLKTNKKFEALAASFSVTPEAKSEGLVGWVERGMLEVFDKAFDLPLNTASSTFASPYGFHIFRVEGKIPAGHQSIIEVKSNIIKELRGQREQALFKSWLDKEIRQIHIFKDHKMIQAMSVETRGN